MFDHRHYVPVLKSKQNELLALGELEAGAAARCTPLIEIMPPAETRSGPPPSLEDQLQTVVRRLAVGRGDADRVFIDTRHLRDSMRSDGKHPLVDLFDRMRDEIAAVPVGGLNRSRSHENALATVAETDGSGAVLRLESEDVFEAGGLDRAVNDWLDAVSLTPGVVDLVVDLGALRAGTTDDVVAGRETLRALPRLHQWRSLTLAGGAFPEDLNKLAEDKTYNRDRHDWLLFLRVLAGRLPRKPAFGDYSIHDTRVQTGGGLGNAHLRFSADSHWVIVRRQNLRRATRFKQYYDACAILRGRAEFDDADHCFGCRKIAACVAPESTGQQGSWLKAGDVHHITVATDQVAKLP
jgi:hypothetical protein